MIVKIRLKTAEFAVFRVLSRSTLRVSTQESPPL